METLDKGSTVLGMFTELPNFNVSKIKIKTNFNIFCYTDGLIETQNDFGEFYGFKRLLKLFSTIPRISKHYFYFELELFYNHISNLTYIHRSIY